MTAAKRKIAKHIAIWQRMSFWERIERTLTTLGGATILMESIFGASAIVTGITAGLTVLAQHLAIWFDDKNNDGVADVFQKLEFTEEFKVIVTETKPQVQDENIP